MKYEKDYIIQEIIRTAKENVNIPLGISKFEKETGMKRDDFLGRYWAKWSDALGEAGYAPNKFNEAYDEEFMIKKLTDFIRELGRFPSPSELSVKSYNDKTFPNKATFYNRFGRKKEKIVKVIEYCKTHEEWNDVLEICLPLLQNEKEVTDEKTTSETINFGFVYLMKSGKFYKIGRSNDADRRAYELKIQLPEKLEIVHKIKTDDPIGIEEYWHKRFKNKRKNGEWFELTRQDVEIFKRRKFM